MTIRRKDEGTLEEIGWGKATKVYRWVLLGAVLAATPVGNNLLNLIGIKTPVAAELAALSSDVAAVKSDTAALKLDVAHLKEDVTTLKIKSDKLENQTSTLQLAFTGFQIDFDKYRKEPK